MTVKELIEKLSTLESDSQVLIRFMHGDNDGHCFKDLEDFDEDGVKVNGNTVIFDISNK